MKTEGDPEPKKLTSKVFEEGGKKRRLYQTECAECGCELWRRKDYITLYGNNFCNIKCQNDYKKTGSIVECCNCGKEIYRKKTQIKRSKSGDCFCSRRCATIVNNTRHKKWENHPNYLNGMSSYRRVGLEHYGSKCQNPDCELKLKDINIVEKMLDVHHIDGDRTNNDVSNLVVLCVYCHALVTRGLMILNEDIEINKLAVG